MNTILSHVPQPAELIALAGFVYALIQLVKRQFPKVSGWWAIALNLALNLSGAVMIAQPGQVKTSGFWFQALLAAGSSAGLHGTVGSLNTPTTPASELAADTVQAAQQTQAAVKASDTPPGV
jgi:hypothetical protein